MSPWDTTPTNEFVGDPGHGAPGAWAISNMPIHLDISTQPSMDNQKPRVMQLGWRGLESQTGTPKSHIVIHDLNE